MKQKAESRIFGANSRGSEKMRSSRVAGPNIYFAARPNRFILLLKGVVLTAVLIVFVLLMQATWSVAKSVWPVLPEAAPPVMTATPISHEPSLPIRDIDSDRI
jgi:hypothetical protein